MKTELNQELKTVDIISMFALIAVILAIVTVVLARNVENKDVDRAKYHSARLTQQILASGLSVVPSTEPKRGLASQATATNMDFLGYEGKISKDPWGHPYNYRVFQKESKLVGVAVWSSGPNGTSETVESDLRFHEESSAVFGRFRGDDVGSIEMVN
jgi:hypothetical protein